jgi:hypothetical protein
MSRNIRSRLARLEAAEESRHPPAAPCRCIVVVGEEDFEPDEHGCCRKCGLERRGQHIEVVEEVVIATGEVRLP